jgi:pyruvate dehydrogenase E2 component (dihydrolipoyllysine-residue acetyltransferase)
MDIKLPSLGEGADSGTVVNIMVKEGDQIQNDQPILELETEKAVGTIPASAAGTVEKVRVKVGDKISAGQVILTLDGGAAPAAPATAPHEVTRPTTTPVTSTSSLGKTIPGIPPPASPSVRRMAAQLGIDLSQVRGSEHGGRITVEDVRAHVRQPQPAAAERVDFAQWGPVVRKPLSSLRKTIARRMGESWSAVPRVTQFDEADVTALNELRKKHAKLTLTPLAMKAVVATLKKHPIFNSSFDETAGAIVLKEYYHIGIAVDTEHGLLVPVIRDADKKGVLELSKELEDLAAKARERKLSADQMRGGTFTISNQGGIGGAHFTPIVNTPEVAILGMGRGGLKPVVRDGKIEPRLMLPLALSYDHRVIDGGSAARFIVDLVKAFENFSEWDMGI